MPVHFTTTSQAMRVQLPSVCPGHVLIQISKFATLTCLSKSTAMSQQFPVGAHAALHL